MKRTFARLVLVTSLEVEVSLPYRLASSVYITGRHVFHPQLEARYNWDWGVNHLWSVSNSRQLHWNSAVHARVGEPVHNLNINLCLPFMSTNQQLFFEILARKSYGFIWFTSRVKKRELNKCLQEINLLLTSGYPVKLRGFMRFMFMFLQTLSISIQCINSNFWSTFRKKMMIKLSNKLKRRPVSYAIWNED